MCIPDFYVKFMSVVKNFYNLICMMLLFMHFNINMLCSI